MKSLLQKGDWNHWDDEDIPEGRLLHATNSTSFSSPPLQGECRVILVSMPPLQAMHCPEGVHKSPQPTEDHWNQTSDLQGQHVTNGQFGIPHSRTHL